ncbi:uncharacterized protein EV420DRAFT_275047 [Desarmillaria tabescens]|uniref:Uncharacterized protein n=1 Tax=Armillaria tabescens TaxID=1929756 RepID=A0AA39N680_ARMTA|nr:uncharacterized protein EV420DRAFT_275047 [Desarmillaria tabescens]KAK0459586.1 hypothetical protein EV420DRAFT_275047 [Desarmillaria tabescens]
MVQMEVDMFSPASAFHSMSKFNTSSKRPRPTEEDSPSSRPVKRLTPALGDGLPSPLFTNSLPSSGSSSRHPSEDWVQQTGGLSIGTPKEYVPDSESNSDTMDLDDVDEPSTLAYGPGRPVLLPLQTTFPSTSHTRDTFAAHRQSPRNLSPSFTDANASRPLANHAQGSFLSRLPSIDVTPPTPETIRVEGGIVNVTRPRTPVSDSLTPMNISMESGGLRSSTLSPTKRQRVTMGPRSDCEKCRLGVKGHWMHVD